MMIKSAEKILRPRRNLFMTYSATVATTALVIAACCVNPILAIVVDAVDTEPSLIANQGLRRRLTIHRSKQQLQGHKYKEDTMHYVGHIQGHRRQQQQQQQQQHPKKQRRRAVSSGRSNRKSANGRIRKWGVKDVHKDTVERTAPHDWSEFHDDPQVHNIDSGDKIPAVVALPVGGMGVMKKEPTEAVMMQKRLVTISKSPNYGGEFNPLGTVGISYNEGRGGSTVFAVDVNGLDPACMNTDIPFDRETDTGGNDTEEKEGGPGGKDHKKSGGGDSDVGRCLCGYCADCSTLTDIHDINHCYEQDSCRFVGHGYDKPHVLYLRYDTSTAAQTADEKDVSFINIYFKAKRHQEDSCRSTVMVDPSNGLFRVSKPESCNDKHDGIGAEVSIDYKGDDAPDVSIHSSCSVPLYLGMAIEGGPFILDGYCLDGDEGEGGICSYSDPALGGSVCGARFKSDDGLDTLRPATNPPSSSPTKGPTSTPTHSPSMSPTDTPTVKPTKDPTSSPTVSPTAKPVPSPTPRPTPLGRNPIISNPTPGDQGAVFDPNSSLTSYQSAGCGPRGHDAVADRGECTYGYIMVQEMVGESQEIVAIINGCQYFSFQVFECLPPAVSLSISHPAEPLAKQETIQDAGSDGLTVEEELQRRPPREYLRVGPKKRRDLIAVNPYSPLFDPTSTLVGYISEDCGPRGKVALADLSQCEYGHEKIEWVPWQEDRVAAHIDGCNFFSFEVYECLPPPFDYPAPISNLLSTEDARPPRTSTDQEELGKASSCAVIVTNGSCDEPGSNGLVLGSTAKNELSVDDTFRDGKELDGQILLVHDQSGTAIGCGEIQDEIESAACLCGYCSECEAFMGPECSKHDSCWFNGNKSAKPHSLYLKLRVADEYLTQINVYFKGNKSCQATVDKDSNGLFHISKPGYCDDADDGVGTEVAIDYMGDSAPDVAIHTSCSVPLYAGMPIEGSPFAIEGYCIGEDGGSCTHIDQMLSVCSSI